MDTPTSNRSAKLDQILAEVMKKQERGESIDVAKLLVEHHDLAESLLEYFDNARLMRNLVAGDPEDTKPDRVADPEESSQRPPQGFAKDATLANSKNGEFGTVGLSQEFIDGDRPFGRYRIERMLGEGGMGTVYLAHDDLLNRKVALKTPRFASSKSKEHVRRFHREAQAAANLHNRNICPVHDVGQIEGIDYLTMAYIEGKPLSAYVSTQRPLAERQIALIIRKLALGLQAAHDAGVIHRDLKPSNVLIDRDGEPVVMDFGLAGRMETSDDSRITAVGSIMGTPAYMSPEQVRGAQDKIGPRSDIYSLGVIFFELLTGRLPYQGSSVEVMSQILVGKPPELRTLRPGLDSKIESICQRMLSKSRRDRYACMRDIADELTKVIRRSRLADLPSPPVVQEAIQPAGEANITAEELAAIADNPSKRSSKVMSDQSDASSRWHTAWFHAKDWFRKASSETRLVVLMPVALITMAFAFAAINTRWTGESRTETALDLSEQQKQQPHQSPANGTPLSEDRGEDRGETIIEPPAASDRYEQQMEAIYQSIEIDRADTVGKFSHAGDPVTISFDLFNKSNLELPVPFPPPFNRFHGKFLGAGRVWIERQGHDNLVPALEGYTPREGSKYAVKTWQIWGPDKIGPYERLPRDVTIQTDLYPLGAFKCLIEFLSVDGKVISESSVYFNLLPKVDAASPPPQAPPQEEPENGTPQQVADPKEPADDEEENVPPIINIFTDILFDLTGDAADDEDDDEEDLDGEANPWSIAPPNTRAMSVIPNMQAFSDKLDHVAKLLGIDGPKVLESAIEEEKIDEGLKRDGSLMWVLGPMKNGQTPTAYLLPSDNHELLIKAVKNLKQQDDGEVQEVTVQRVVYQTKDMKNGHSVFTERKDNEWLKAFRQGNDRFDQKLGPCNEFLRRQDIGFVLTQEGAEEGVSLRTPFAKGKDVIPATLPSLARSSSELLGLKSFGGGTEIIPGNGIRVSVVTAFAADSKASTFARSLTLKRDDLLKSLPNGPLALAIGSSSCTQWNEILKKQLNSGFVTSFGEEQGSELSKDIHLATFRGATLLITAFEEIPAEEIAKQVHLQVYVDDADQALDGLHQFLQRLAPMIQQQRENRAAVEISTEDHDGQKVLTLEVQENISDRKPLTYVFSLSKLDKTTLILQGGDGDHLRSVLEKISSGELLQNQPQVSKTVQLITEDSQQLLLFNACHCATLVQQQMTDKDIEKFVQMFLAGLDQSPPLGVGNRFRNRSDELSVVAPDEFLSAFAQTQAFALAEQFVAMWLAQMSR